jgi:hypothetical protein
MKSGRNTNGQFAPGNPGGPGRPKRATESDYIRALSDACPIEVWQEIVGKAVEEARAGNPAARMWLGKYLMNNTSLNASVPLSEFELSI